MTQTRSRDRLKLPQPSNTVEGSVHVDDGSDEELNRDVDVKMVSKKEMAKRKKTTVEAEQKRGVIVEKKKKATKPQSQDIKSFYGYKCYLDQLIDEVNRVGTLMDDKTMKMLMQTPFSGFFAAILEGKITTSMVQRCTKSITSIIHMYTGEGDGFQFSEKGVAAHLTVTDVACILGIRTGEEIFDTHEKVLGKCGIFEEKYFNVQRINRRGLADEMSKVLGKKKISDEERVDVVRILILYSFATFFFANTSGSVAKAIVKKFDDMPYVNRCCWPSLIHHHLMESIKKHYKSTEPNVSGCVYILLYFFLEHTSLYKPVKGREMSEPRMTKWDLKQVTGTNWETTMDRLSQQEVYKRKGKDVEPSSLTRRVKGRSRKESQRRQDFVYNKTAKEEIGRLTHPSNSIVWDLLSEDMKGKLIHLWETAERSTIVWETEDLAGKLFLMAVLVEDLYMGAMISTDLLDWFFRWRIPNFSNKYSDIRETQMTGCFALRAGCYTQWNSDDTAETGFEMIQQDIKRKLNPCTYQSAMFVPMLVSECHWILLVLDIDLMQWYIYNSIPVEDFENDDGTLAANLFRMYLQKVLLPKIRNVRRDPTLVFKRDILQEHGPIQQNGYDCGLFICKYVEHRILRGSYIWGQKEIDDLRVEFIGNIMSGGGIGWNQQLLLEGGNK